MKRFKILFPLLLVLSLFLYDCGGKKKVIKEFETNINKNISTDEIKLATNFGKVIESKENYIAIKLDKNKQELIKENYGNLENYLLKIFKENCFKRNGKLDVIDKELNKKLEGMVYNQLQSNEFPDIYIKEYLKNDYKVNSILVKKFYKIPEDTLLFCYLPKTKNFYTLTFKGNLIKIFRGSVLKILPYIAQEEAQKLKEKIYKIIKEDLKNMVWFSLNLPLVYKGVKLYYFEARPVYETEEDKKANLGTDRWDIYLKLENKTLKPFIFNLGKITLIKEGVDYKPLFKIDENGNIKGINISGDCKRIEDNKVIIYPNSRCNIYYLYDNEKKEGGLKFLGITNLKGSVLVIDKYPIYIWNMTTYEMKLKGLSIENK